MELFQILVERGIGLNLIRSFLAMLDFIVFWFLSLLMELIFNVARTEVISGAVMENFAGRVYAILGIFMLFKVAITVLGYVINPDSLVDKEKGFGKMIQRVIVVLVMLLVFSPSAEFSVFKLLDEAQEVFFPVLPRVVIGSDMNIFNTDEGEGGELLNSMSNVGDNISWSIYSAFFTYNTDTCFDPSTKPAIIQAATDASGADVVDTVKEAMDAINDPCEGDKEQYMYSYTPIIPLAIGIFVDYVLLFFCIQVAVRAFKLAILKLVAPIPIISYVDPKASKDGGFNNWLKMLISTWLDLFITLGVVYFIIFFINQILTNPPSLPEGVPGAFVLITLILGLLIFAKDAPKFISKALGLKGAGLGMGMAGALAAAGTVAGGGSLAAAAKNAAGQMSSYSTADVDGKASASGAFGKGKEAAIKLNGGHSAGEQRKLKRQAESLGVNSDTVKKFKDEAKAAGIASAEASSIRDKALNNNLSSGDISTLDTFFNENPNELASWSANHGGAAPTDLDRADIMSNLRKTESEDATKRFENVSAYAKDVGIKDKTNAEKLGAVSTKDKIKDAMTSDSSKRKHTDKVNEQYTALRDKMTKK